MNAVPKTDTSAIAELNGRLVSIERSAMSDRTTVTFEDEDKKRFYIGGLPMSRPSALRSISTSP